MAIEYIKKQKKWNEPILKQGSNFMQSWEWGEFRIKTGIPVFRIGNRESGIGNNYIQIEKRKLPFGRCYFYIAGSPQNINEKSFKQIKNLAKKEKAIFLKWESLQNFHLCQNLGEQAKFKIQTFPPRFFRKTGRFFNSKFKKSVNIQPKNTLVLDITLSEEELFKNFHPKHRYNIRLAERKGIKIKKIKTEKEFENFYKLIKKTDERKHTKSFPKKYYKELFSLSQKSKFELTDIQHPSSLIVEFLGAYLKNIMVAGMILIVWNKTMTYLVGASDYKYRKYMAPHLLQWHAIKKSKELGCLKYDFWGIIKKTDFENEKEFEHHHWAGITRFKTGFGGKTTSHASAYDYIFSPIWYKMYRAIKKFK
jgi:lipid II:glycine glycyltransferase (peptidoglycan interpeptide bridge formation enzyme)